MNNAPNKILETISEPPQETIKIFKEQFLSSLEALQYSDKKVLIVPISGLSGVGKSTFTNEIIDISKSKNMPVVKIMNDFFIGTESGSAERKSMIDSWHNFKNLFYEKERIISLIQKIIQTSGPSYIKEKNTYQRVNQQNQPHGKLDGIKEIFVPNKKFVLIVDGVNSVEYAQTATQNKNDCLVSGFTVIDKPSESILRATFRDAERKNCDFKGILEARMHEYFYMQNWIIKNLNQSTILNVTGKLDHVSDIQIKAYAQKNNQTPENVQQEILKVVKNFNEQKLSKNYPEKFKELNKKIIMEYINKYLS